MLGLPRLGSLKHAARARLTLRSTIAKGPPKSVRSRSTLGGMQTTGDTNRSFSSLSDNSPSNSFRGVGTIDDAITRSSGSSCSCGGDAVVPTSEVQTAAVELPEIPRLPKKRTFHIDHTNLEAHVQPLLSCHWHVAHVGNAVEDDDHRVLSLNKLFRFKDFCAAVDFFDALANVQEEERHHARVTVDYAYVYVSVHTHVAYQLGSISGPDVDAKPIKIPGLTARDVRFAVMVERLHEQFLGDGRAVTKVPAGSAGLRAWSMEQLLRRYPPHGQDAEKEKSSQTHD